MVSAGLLCLPPLPFSLAGCCVDLCASRQLLLASSEAQGLSTRFHGLSGHPARPQPELLMGKAGGAPYFWDCRSGGAPGFPVHGPAAGQYSPAGGWVRAWCGAAHWLDEHSRAVSGHGAHGRRWMTVYFNAAATHVFTIF